MLKKVFSHLCSKFFLRVFLISFLIALLAGHFIVTHGRRETLSELLAMPSYYYSVIYSALIALILQLAIYTVSYKLSLKYNGKGLTFSWGIRQFFFGFVMVLLLELFLAAALFALHGLWLPETAFFRKLFGDIVLFVLVINLGHIIYFMHLNPIVKHTVRLVVQKKTESEPILPDEMEAPALILKCEEGLFAYDFHGNKTGWVEPINASLKRLGQNDYYSGQRHWMVHRLAILELENISVKRILLKLNIQVPCEIIVSRRRSPEFKVWYDNLLFERTTG